MSEYGAPIVRSVTTQDEKDKLCILADRGTTLAQAADAMVWDYQRVMYWEKRLGIQFKRILHAPSPRKKRQKHCEQCGKVLGFSSNRMPRKRFCSTQCTRGYINDHRLNKTLTEEQEGEIIRLRMAKKPFKVVARQVGCTPDQVYHIWRSHKNKGTTLFQRHQRAERLAAKVSLAAEIAAAKAEMPTAAPYKNELYWG